MGACEGVPSLAGPMAHRAGTGDAPIPGLVTSRRNPAYKLKPRPQAVTNPNPPQSKSAFDSGLKGQHARRRKSRSPSRRASPQRNDSEERRLRELKEEEDRRQRERRDEESRRRRREEEESQKQRWAEQERAWAEERKAREDQRKLEEQRQKERKNKLKGAFAMKDELSEAEDEDQDRARELVERRKKSAAASQPLPATGHSSFSGSVSRAGSPENRNGATGSKSLALSVDGSGSKEDAVRLRASLADPSAPRSHAPGEVAEHFRRLSEMKRRFRRAEFGGPDRRRDLSRSRSRSRDKYNSVWIRPGGSR